MEDLLGLFTNLCKTGQTHVPCPVNCELCNNTMYDEWHIFFQCQVSLQCWLEAGLHSVVLPLVGAILLDICSREVEVTVTDDDDYMGY